MLGFLLTPRWLVLHLFTVLVIAGTLVAGSWQMEAYVEQEERQQLAERSLAEDAEAEPLAEVVPVGQALPLDSVGRRVETAGRYDADQTLLLPEREVDGQVGFYVITPLVDAEGVATPVLRGWVEQPSSAGVTPPAGQVEVEGLVEAMETDRDATVRSGQALPEGQVPALTKATVFRLYPYPPETIRQAQVVVVDEQPTAAATPTRIPVEKAAPSTGGVSAWRHLSYAWQWWLFAAAAVVFWGAFVRNGAREAKAAADQPDPSSHQGLP